MTLPNLTTMDRQMQNAHSTQASVEIEHQLGAVDHGERGLLVPAGLGPDHLDQPERPRPASPRAPTTAAGPNPAYANNSQYSSEARSSYHGLHLSLLQRPARWGYYRVSYTLSKARNNVGEFFFSSPIDPFDLEKDWGRSDDDQRHRLVVHAAVNTSREPGTTLWTHLSHGFQLSGTLQYYSALPLNITSGVTTVQGTAGRPIVDGAFIPRNAGTGPGLLHRQPAPRAATFTVRGRARVEALAEVFNLTNRENVVAMNGNFGPGAYPTSPSADVRPDHGRGRAALACSSALRLSF